MSIFEAFNDISVAGFTKGIYAVLPLVGLLIVYKYYSSKVGSFDSSLNSKGFYPMLRKSKSTLR
jgi:hypothetical protein